MNEECNHFILHSWPNPDDSQAFKGLQQSAVGSPPEAKGRQGVSVLCAAAALPQSSDGAGVVAADDETAPKTTTETKVMRVTDTSHSMRPFPAVVTTVARPGLLSRRAPFSRYRLVDATSYGIVSLGLEAVMCMHVLRVELIARAESRAKCEETNRALSLFLIASLVGDALLFRASMVCRTP